MDFALTQAQDDVALLARRLFAENVDEDRRWRLLSETGLCATEGLLEICTLLEEQGKATAPAPLWSTLAGARLPIERFGSETQRKRYLEGDGVVAAALCEPASQDASRPSTTATASASGGGWLIDGEKLAVPPRADRLLVPATSSGGVILAIVDPRAAGVTLAPQTLTSGEAAHQVTLHRVLAEDVLGSEESGRAILEWTVARATVALCALELGVAERALAMTAAYTTARVQFERPIATFQAVAQRAADAYIDVEAMRLTLWRAAWLLAEGRDDQARVAVSLAKWWAAEAGHRVVYAAQHLHGGIGFDVSYPLGSCYLWSKQIELTLGSASCHLARVGAELARSP